MARSSMLVSDNTYARLPDRFFARTKPTPVEKPRAERLFCEGSSSAPNAVLKAAA